jgi:hypothetical protein
VTTPSFRASGTLQAVTTGAVGGVLPASMTEGEIVVFQVGIFGGGADEDVGPVWVAGDDEATNPWRPLIPGTGIKKRTVVGTDYAAGFFTKKYVAADWVNPSLSVDDSDTQAKYGVLHVYNNSDPTTGLWFEGSTWNNGGASGTRTGPSVVTTGANRLVCNAFCFVDDDAVALDGTDPGYAIDNQQGSAVSFDARNLIASITKAAAGTQTGAVITDPGTGSDHWVAGGWAFFGGADEAGVSIAANAGSYAVTGSTATLKVGRRVAADAGSYTHSGTDATLRRGLPISALAGSYALTGATASFLTTRVLGGSAGSYSLTGSEAALTVGGEAVATQTVQPTGGWGDYDYFNPPTPKRSPLTDREKRKRREVLARIKRPEPSPEIDPGIVEPVPEPEAPKAEAPVEDDEAHRQSWREDLDRLRRETAIETAAVEADAEAALLLILAA